MNDSTISRMTVESLFDTLAIFFFSTLFLIFALLIPAVWKDTSFTSTISLFLYIGFAAGYYYLFLVFLLHYTNRLGGWAKDIYSKHAVLFNAVALLVFAGSVILSLILYLGFEKVVTQVSGAAIMALLAVVWYKGIKPMWEAHQKKNIGNEKSGPEEKKEQEPRT